MSGTAPPGDAKPWVRAYPPQFSADLRRPRIDIAQQRKCEGPQRCTAALSADVVSERLLQRPPVVAAELEVEPSRDRVHIDVDIGEGEAEALSGDSRIAHLAEVHEVVLDPKAQVAAERVFNAAAHDPAVALVIAREG